MKTEFKVFDSDWGYSSIEDSIKEYQKEHHLEVRNVVVLRRTEEGLVVGAVFERSSEYEELEEMKYRSAKWLYGEVGR